MGYTSGKSLLVWTMCEGRRLVLVHKGYIFPLAFLAIPIELCLTREITNARNSNLLSFCPGETQYTCAHAYTCTKPPTPCSKSVYVLAANVALIEVRNPCSPLYAPLDCSSYRHVPRHQRGNQLVSRPGRASGSVHCSIKSLCLEVVDAKQGEQLRSCSECGDHGQAGLSGPHR